MEEFESSTNLHGSDGDLPLLKIWSQRYDSEFLSVFLTKEQTKPLFMQNEALFNKQAHFLHFFCLLLSGATWHMHKWWSNTKKSE